LRLSVKQLDTLVGYLESTPDRGIVFRYDEAYLGSRGAHPLSHSLPLREKPFSQTDSMPFFSGLLPDGDQRRRIAAFLHVSENSAFKLLDALGGECAGTVSLLREGDEVESPLAGYDEFGREDLERLIMDAERRPLLAPTGGARLSLAGAQAKIPLYRRDGRWFLPRGGTPSSHVLKSASPVFPDLAANEFLVMRLAAAIGLAVPPVELETIGRPTLIVERYDRMRQPDGSVRRIHQEDCCQALGIMPEGKYEADGGPGFAAISRLLREICTVPLAGIEALIDIALFNVLVGNCDAHGKNYSLLYRGEGTTLAPFYDLVSTSVYPELSPMLSMRIGGEYRIDCIRAADFDAFARDIGVKARVVTERFDALAGNAEKAWTSILGLEELSPHARLCELIRSGWDERLARLRGV